MSYYALISWYCSFHIFNEILSLFMTFNEAFFLSESKIKPSKCKHL